jgi:type IV secretory pathway VirD2 relaxase
LAGARPGGRDLRRAIGRRSDVARADREDTIMPDKKTIERARQDERDDRAPVAHRFFAIARARNACTLACRLELR